MTIMQGRLGWVGIANESTPGVPANPVDYLPFHEASLQAKMTPLADVAARGIRDGQGENSQLGKQWGEGALKVNLDPTLAPRLLGLTVGTFGSPVSEGGGVYTHTLSRNNSNTPQSASVIFNRGNDQLLFPYSVVNSLDLSYDEGLAEVTANLMSRSPVASTSGTLTTTSGTIFAWRHAQVQLGSNITNAQNSASYIPLKSFKLNVNNSSELQYVSGNRDVNSIIHKDFIVSGSFRLAFETTTQRDAFNALSKNSMVVTFTGNGIGNNMSEFIKLRLYKIRYDDYKVNVAPDEYISEDITFMAEYSSGDSATMDFVVRNRKSSY